MEAFLVGVVRGRGDRAVVCGERPADRLDPAEAVPVPVDERYERVCGRSSSAARKPAAACRNPSARFSARTGCQWRYLPEDFPPWPAVYWYFTWWHDEGIVERLHGALRVISRWR